MADPQYIADKILAIAKRRLTDEEFSALLAAQEFEDESDWRIPPIGYGLYRYCPIRFRAYIDHFKIVGVAPPECATWEPLKNEQDFTYFALGKVSSLIKIGRSRQPEHRISTLRYDPNGESAYPLVIIPGGRLERWYHNVFEQWREDGEWFAPHPDILAEIARLSLPRLRPAR